MGICGLAHPAGSFSDGSRVRHHAAAVSIEQSNCNTTTGRLAALSGDAAARSPAPRGSTATKCRPASWPKYIARTQRRALAQRPWQPTQPFAGPPVRAAHCKVERGQCHTRQLASTRQEPGRRDPVSCTASFGSPPWLIRLLVRKSSNDCRTSAASSRGAWHRGRSSRATRAWWASRLRGTSMPVRTSSLHARSRGRGTLRELVDRSTPTASLVDPALPPSSARSLTSCESGRNCPPSSSSLLPR